MSDPKASNENMKKPKLKRWWIKTFLTPLLFLAVGALLIFGLGLAQRLGWISAGGGGTTQQAVGSSDTRYICPMMCTPPQTEPGRCPVCAMELVPVTSSGDDTDELSIQVSPVARRIANIQTVAVQSVPFARKIRAIGAITYNEGTLATISAYVDGRLDRLFADYTGVLVNKGDQLAWLYSPQLYTTQVELLRMKRGLEELEASSASTPAIESQQRLYQSARQRLIELGTTEEQIQELEQIGRANSSMHIYSPISGTVIEKLADKGRYVKTGQPIYRVADLSTVWLMLELFPDDAAVIRYGQKVQAEVQSLPGRQFPGRVAFIDRNVDPKTRTVGVRVVVPNEEGLLRIGDYAKATIEVPGASDSDAPQLVYDSELANKWISPRHPHVVESAPGKCRECGVELVPAATFGFAAESVPSHEALIVPRNAVLMAGDNSVVFVETEPGRFEIRWVVLGPSTDGQIVLLKGVKKGEQIATSGNFLLDAAMQMAGKPSLIDPTKAKPIEVDEGKSEKIVAALSKLSDEDRALAEKQKICPVTKQPLGSMGTPVKVDVDGRPIFICCKGCEKRLLDAPDKYLANLGESAPEEASNEELPQMDLPPVSAPQIVAEPVLPAMEVPQDVESPETEDDEATAIAEALAKLSPADRALAEKQKNCPVADMPLGSMGTPIKVDVDDRHVFICCEGCREDLLAEPAKYLAKLRKEAAQ
ncbi:MAG: efflux RND transporter periplasmic adaptor subunit [Planctomycetes bacterium]|nr:efflux RND transporter periplasmic adaptor subunit [Planctomycetota bacterium]MBL7042027.1 efflux RND transporter periplasmic adaptor subunit [Pirellulaceae bacterium]